MCEVLGLGKPLKNIDERMKIMEQIRGVDFVFRVSSLQKDLVKENAEKSYRIYDYYKKLETCKNQVSNKKYKLGYAPGTYDLFHAGHLENLLLASKDCERLIVGVKSDELVQEHKNRRPILADDERMEKRSTTNYRKLYLGNEENKKYKGKINRNIKKRNKVDKNKDVNER